MKTMFSALILWKVLTTLSSFSLALSTHTKPELRKVSALRASIPKTVAIVFLLANSYG
jgi:hypothetical protein